MFIFIKECFNRPYGRPFWGWKLKILWSCYMHYIDIKTCNIHLSCAKQKLAGDTVTIMMPYFSVNCCPDLGKSLCRIYSECIYHVLYMHILYLNWFILHFFPTPVQLVIIKQSMSTGKAASYYVNGLGESPTICHSQHVQLHILLLNKFYYIFV